MTATESCAKGHPYTEENLRIVTVRGKQTRQCRQCDKERAQAKRDRLRGDKKKFARTLAEKCFRGHLLEGENLYYYETKEWGRQRRCRSCDEIRRHERVARGETVQPTKEFCINDHPLSGDNISFTPEGFARCKLCSLAATMRHKEANYEHVMEGKRRNRRAAKDTVLESAWKDIVAIYAEDLDDDVLIRRLRAALPPAEQ